MRLRHIIPALALVAACSEGTAAKPIAADREPATTTSRPATEDDSWYFNACANEVNTAYPDATTGKRMDLAEACELLLPIMTDAQLEAYRAEWDY